MIKQLKQFFLKDIWLIDLNQLNRYKRTYIKTLQIAVLSLKGFNEDKVQLRASALTYYSLLSIVPVVAMAFGIAKGFGMEEKLNQVLMEKLSSHQDIMNQVIDFANSLLNNTKGGLIAGIGVILLFWSVLKVLGNIENSFNDIWGISKGRTLVKKFTEYLSIMLLAPLLLILSSSLTVFISSKTKEVVNSVGVLEYVDQEISFLLGLSPYIVFWLLLTMIYMIMPNTKVKFKSALVAGIVSGSLFVIVQWAYVTFQIGVVQYNAIYGSFAALPLFLVWLQTSWIIVLFGAELSFMHQNIEQYILKEESKRISLSFKNKLSIYISHFIIQNFYKGEATSLSTIIQELKLPFRVASRITNELVDCKILTRIENSEYKKLSFQPAIDTSRISVNYIINSLEKRGNDEIPFPDHPLYEKISEVIDQRILDEKDILIKDLKN